MSIDKVQFQHGMSLLEFMELYGSEEQCIQALFRQRWPEGFRCPRCSGDQAYRVATAGRPRFQCRACRFQASLTAGTLMQDSKLALGARTGRHSGHARRAAVTAPSAGQRYSLNSARTMR